MCSSDKCNSLSTEIELNCRKCIKSLFLYSTTNQQWKNLELVKSIKIYKLRRCDHNFIIKWTFKNIFYWNKQWILLLKLMNNENSYEN